MAVWFGTLFASAGLLGCRDKGPGAAAALPEVTVITAQRDPVRVTTELPGRTSAYLVAQVRARANLESTRAQAERDKVLVAASAISEHRYINESRHKVRRPRPCCW